MERSSEVREVPSLEDLFATSAFTAGTRTAESASFEALARQKEWHLKEVVFAGLRPNEARNKRLGLAPKALPALYPFAEFMSLTDEQRVEALAGLVKRKIQAKLENRLASLAEKSAAFLRNRIDNLKAKHPEETSSVGDDIDFFLEVSTKNLDALELSEKEKFKRYVKGEMESALSVVLESTEEMFKRELRLLSAIYKAPMEWLYSQSQDYLSPSTTGPDLNMLYTRLGYTSIYHLTGLACQQVWYLIGNINDKWRSFTDATHRHKGNFKSFKGWYIDDSYLNLMFKASDIFYNIFIEYYKYICTCNLHILPPTVLGALNSTLLASNTHEGIKAVHQLLATNMFSIGRTRSISYSSTRPKKKQTYVHRMTLDNPAHHHDTDQTIASKQWRWLRSSYVQVKIPNETNVREVETDERNPYGTMEGASPRPTPYKTVWGIRVIIGGPERNKVGLKKTISPSGEAEGSTRRNIDIFRKKLVINFNISTSAVTAKASGRRRTTREGEERGGSDSATSSVNERDFKKFEKKVQDMAAYDKTNLLQLVYHPPLEITNFKLVNLMHIIGALRRTANSPVLQEDYNLRFFPTEDPSSFEVAHLYKPLLQILADSMLLPIYAASKGDARSAWDMLARRAQKHFASAKFNMETPMKFSSYVAKSTEETETGERTIKELYRDDLHLGVLFDRDLGKQFTYYTYEKLNDAEIFNSKVDSLTRKQSEERKKYFKDHWNNVAITSYMYKHITDEALDIFGGQLILGETNNLLSLHKEVLKDVEDKRELRADQLFYYNILQIAFFNNYFTIGESFSLKDFPDNFIAAKWKSWNDFIKAELLPEFQRQLGNIVQEVSMHVQRAFEDLTSEEIKLNTLSEDAAFIQDGTTITDPASTPIPSDYPMVGLSEIFPLDAENTIDVLSDDDIEKIQDQSSITVYGNYHTQLRAKTHPTKPYTIGIPHPDASIDKKIGIAPVVPYANDPVMIVLYDSEAPDIYQHMQPTVKKGYLDLREANQITDPREERQKDEVLPGSKPEFIAAKEAVSEYDKKTRNVLKFPVLGSRVVEEESGKLLDINDPSTTRFVCNTSLDISGYVDLSKNVGAGDDRGIFAPNILDVKDRGDEETKEYLNRKLGDLPEELKDKYFVFNRKGIGVSKIGEEVDFIPKEPAGMYSSKWGVAMCDVRSLIGRSGLSGYLHSDKPSELDTHPGMVALVQRLWWPLFPVRVGMQEEGNYTTEKMRVEVVAEYDTGLLLKPGLVKPEIYKEEVRHKQSSYGFTMGAATEVVVPIPKYAEPIFKYTKKQPFYQVHPDNMIKNIFALSDVIYPHRWRQYMLNSSLNNASSYLERRAKSGWSVIAEQVEDVKAYCKNSESQPKPHIQALIHYLFCSPMIFDAYTSKVFDTVEDLTETQLNYIKRTNNLIRSALLGKTAATRDMSTILEEYEQNICNLAKMTVGELEEILFT